MVDEHTRESLLNLMERSISGEAVVEELKKVFAANGRPPKVLRPDKRTIDGFASAAAVLRDKTGMVYVPPDNRGTTAASNRSTTDYARSASTATTGPPCSRPPWSSATSRPNTTTDTGTHTPVACSIN
jgi:hypothetical protein